MRLLRSDGSVEVEREAMPDGLGVDEFFDGVDLCTLAAFRYCRPLAPCQAPMTALRLADVGNFYGHKEKVPAPAAPAGPRTDADPFDLWVRDTLMLLFR